MQLSAFTCTDCHLTHRCPECKPGWTPLHFAYDNGRIELVELLVAKGGDKSIKNVDEQVPKDRLVEFKRREELREKTNTAKLKLKTLTLLKFSKKKASTAEDAPVVQRSQLVRAAAAGKVTEIDRLLSKGEKNCVPDEFEVNRSVCILLNRLVL